MRRLRRSEDKRMKEALDIATSPANRVSCTDMYPRQGDTLPDPIATPMSAVVNA